MGALTAAEVILTIRPKPRSPCRRRPRASARSASTCWHAAPPTSVLAPVTKVARRRAARIVDQDVGLRAGRQHLGSTLGRRDVRRHGGHRHAVQATDVLAASPPARSCPRAFTPAPRRSRPAPSHRPGRVPCSPRRLSPDARQSHSITLLPSISSSVRAPRAPAAPTASSKAGAPAAKHGPAPAPATRAGERALHAVDQILHDPGVDV